MSTENKDDDKKKKKYDLGLDEIELIPNRTPSNNNSSNQKASKLIPKGENLSDKSITQELENKILDNVGGYLPWNWGDDEYTALPEEANADPTSEALKNLFATDISALPIQDVTGEEVPFMSTQITKPDKNETPWERVKAIPEELIAPILEGDEMINTGFRKLDELNPNGLFDIMTGIISGTAAPFNAIDVLMRRTPLPVVDAMADILDIPKIGESVADILGAPGKLMHQIFPIVKNIAIAPNLPEGIVKSMGALVESKYGIKSDTPEADAFSESVLTLMVYAGIFGIGQEANFKRLPKEKKVEVLKSFVEKNAKEEQKLLTAAPDFIVDAKGVATERSNQLRLPEAKPVEGLPKIPFKEIKKSPDDLIVNEAGEVRRRSDPEKPKSPADFIVTPEGIVIERSELLRLPEAKPVEGLPPEFRPAPIGGKKTEKILSKKEVLETAKGKAESELLRLQQKELNGETLTAKEEFLLGRSKAKDAPKPTKATEKRQSLEKAISMYDKKLELLDEQLKHVRTDEQLKLIEEEYKKQEAGKRDWERRRDELDKKEAGVEPVAKPKATEEVKAPKETKVAEETKATEEVKTPKPKPVEKVKPVKETKSIESENIKQTPDGKFEVIEPDGNKSTFVDLKDAEAWRDKIGKEAPKEVKSVEKPPLEEQGNDIFVGKSVKGNKILYEVIRDEKTGYEFPGGTIRKAFHDADGNVTRVIDKHYKNQKALEAAVDLVKPKPIKSSEPVTNPSEAIKQIAKEEIEAIRKAKEEKSATNKTRDLLDDLRAKEESGRLIPESAKNKAVARLRKGKGGRLNSLPIEEFAQFIKDVTTVGLYHLENGVRKFSDFSTKMIKTVGAKVKPVLKSVWNEINKNRTGLENVTVNGIIFNYREKPREINIRRTKADKVKAFTTRQKIDSFVFDMFEPLRRYAKQNGLQETIFDPTLWGFAVKNKSSIITNWVKGRHAPVIQRDGTAKIYGATVERYLRKVAPERMQDFENYLGARRVVSDHRYIESLEADYLKYRKLKEEIGQGGHTRAEFDKLRAEAKLLKDKADSFERQKAVIENDSWDLGLAEKTVKQFEQEFKAPTKIFDTVNKLLVDSAENSGLISSNRANYYRSREGYASFQRYVEELENFSSVKGNGGSSSTAATAKILKERQGGGGEVISPVYSQVKAISEVMGKGLENLLWNKVHELSLKNKELAKNFVEDPRGTLSFKVDGQQKTFLISEDLASVANNLSPLELGLFSEILRVPSTTMTRATTSANPFFAVGNFFLDQISLGQNTKTGSMPFLSPMKSLPDFIRSVFGETYVAEGVRKRLPPGLRRVANKLRDSMDNFADKDSFAHKKYQALGGKNQTLASYLREGDPAKLVDKLMGNLSGIEKSKNILDSTLNLAEIPSNMSEMMSRFSEYERALKQGKTDIEAMYLASQVTTPFQMSGTFSTGGRHGAVMQNVIRSVPFLNANIQAFYRFGRSAKDQPLRVASVTAAVMASTLSTVLGTWVYSSDKQKRLLGNQKVSELSKAIFLPTPDGDKLVRFKVPEQVGAFTGLVYLYVIGNKQNGTKADWVDYYESLTSMIPRQLDVTKVPLGIGNMFGVKGTEQYEAANSYLGFMTQNIPQVIKPTYETLMGVKSYPEVLPIVPQGLENQPRSEQYTEYTGEVAKTIAHFFPNTSPMLVEHFISNTFGSLGSFVMSPSRLTSSNPLMRSEEQFIVSGRVYDKFHDNWKDADLRYKEAQNTKNLPDSEATKIVDKFVALDRVKDIVGELRKYAKTVKDMPEDIREQAYDLLIEIDETENPRTLLNKIESLSDKSAKLIENSDVTNKRTKFKAKDFDKYTKSRLKELGVDQGEEYEEDGEVETFTTIPKKRSLR